MPREFLDVDPRTLRLPPGRTTGADPIKFSRQLSKFGISFEGMPPLMVIRGRNGELQIVDGVTRAARIARLLPGRTLRVEIIEVRPNYDLGRYPTLGEVLQ